MTYRDWITLHQRVVSAFFAVPFDLVDGAEAARIFAEATGGTLGPSGHDVSVDRSDNEEMHSAGYVFADGHREEWLRHWKMEINALQRFAEAAWDREQRVGAAAVAALDLEA